MIDPAKIGEVVGQRGKTINALIERTGVKIDITDDGAVSVCGTDKEAMDEALRLIEIIVTDFEKGQILEGTVVSIKDFGASVSYTHLDVYKRQVPKEIAEVAFVNVNDGTVEGLRYLQKNIFTVQFHPEACAGPKDSEVLFDEFIKMMEE